MKMDKYIGINYKEININRVKSRKSRFRVPGIYCFYCLRIRFWLAMV